MSERRNIIPPGRARPASNLEKEHAALQERLAQTRQELEKATAALASTEKTQQEIAKELKRLTAQYPSLKNITAEPQALWQELKLATEALSSRDKELKTAIDREQNNQLKAMAQIAELQETIKTSRRELETLQKEKQRGEALWQKERDRLTHSLEQLQAHNKELSASLLERQQQDERFSASLEDLRQAVPALQEVEAKPEPMLKAMLAELLAARQALKPVDDLEKKLKEIAAAEQLDLRLGNVIEENRRLQEQLDASSENSKIFENQAREAAKSADQKIASAVAAVTAQTERNKESLSRKVAALEAENSALQTQLESSGKIASVPPERISMLLEDFYDKLQGNLKGLAVNDSEIRLKVGFGSLSDNRVGFVIPTAGNTAEIKDSLSEITLRLGKKDL